MDRQREETGGYTYSGSSSEYSAYEAYQKGLIGGGGNGGTGKTVTAGPGVDGAQTVPVGEPVAEVAPVTQQTPPAPVTGPGGPRRQSTLLSPLEPMGPYGPRIQREGTRLTPKMEMSVQEMLVDGYRINANPRTSNAEEWEIRYAEPGEWVGGIVVMASDAWYNTKQALGDLSYKANAANNSWAGATHAGDAFGDWFDSRLQSVSPKAGELVQEPVDWGR
ncbi:hypothetical protein [Tortoise microvirus 43]|nr:hypothetical protein [Tortoise microvirus 43]